ncbi:MAG: hypothetical protein KKA07_16470, partial [Bacteroidetes bacterium]|nr:hypothetical protein [Bacteroidota bacterium]
MKRLLSVLSIMTLLSAVSHATVFTVTTTADDGTGSLREAMTYANYYPGGPHSITFNIPQGDAGFDIAKGIWVITLQTALPQITKAGLQVDGTTQTTAQGDLNTQGPEIVLDGNNRTVDYGFFVYNAASVVIKGFTISSFLYGIQIFGGSTTACIIEGNYVGTNYNASDSASCNIGIEVMGGAHNNTVGGTTVAARNIVSGNGHIGIRVVDANHNLIIGNYVGIDRTGTFAVPNYDGVSIEGNAPYNQVGGYTTAERNVVSGNIAYGVPVFGAGAEHNLIVGNYLGTDCTGSFAVPNTYGVLFDDGAAHNVVGGSGQEARNILSGNSAYGVFLYNLGTHANIVKGNFIGTDYTGFLAVPNANGITVDGACFAHIIDSNLISGNLQHGVIVHITHTDSTAITRNMIGCDYSGTGALPNGEDGVRLGEGVKYTVIGGSQ